MKKYTGDFETATWNENETWVWAWAVCEIGKEDNLNLGNSIDTFFKFCKKEKNPEIYFHNLKFDGEFIISYLLNNGYKHIKDKKEKEDKTFTTLITDLGTFYSIEVYFEIKNKQVKKVTFYDSLKIIPLPIVDIPKAFGIKEEKLEIDYLKERKKDHDLTEEEKEYIKHDVIIIAKALNVLFKQKLTKMTQGANALADFKNILEKSRFERYFPRLSKEADSDIRKAYKRWIYLFK